MTPFIPRALSHALVKTEREKGKTKACADPTLSPWPDPRKVQIPDPDHAVLSFSLLTSSQMKQ